MSRAPPRGLPGWSARSVSANRCCGSRRPRGRRCRRSWPRDPKVGQGSCRPSSRARRSGQRRAGRLHADERCGAMAPPICCSSPSSAWKSSRPSSPAPRSTWWGYHGGLATHARWRSLVVSSGRPAPARKAHEGDARPRGAATPGAGSWATLMRCVFAADVPACPRGGSRLRVIATVQDPLAVQAILAHLARSLPTPCPCPAAPADHVGRTPSLGPPHLRAQRALHRAAHSRLPLGLAGETRCCLVFRMPTLSASALMGVDRPPVAVAQYRP